MAGVLTKLDFIPLLSLLVVGHIAAVWRGHHVQSSVGLRESQVASCLLLVSKRAAVVSKRAAVMRKCESRETNGQNCIAR